MLMSTSSSECDRSFRANPVVAGDLHKRYGGGREPGIVRNG
jgi:hypothetical protein